MQGLIKWFIDNPIASNLLMFSLLALGLMSIMTNKQEMFPAIKPNFITVTVVHPGAVPEQTEESICVKIEEALDGVDSIVKIKSTASEGSGMILIEHEDSADKAKVLRDIKNKVDGISTFPSGAESPVVVASEFKMPVLSVAIYGEADSELALRRLAEEIKDEITAMSQVSSVTVVDSKTFEVTIAIDEDKLTEYGISRDQVANAIRASSVNQSGGTLRTDSYGEVLIRLNRKAYIESEFEDIVILQEANGLTVTLGQIAEVNDGFAVFDEFIDFDGKPAVMVTAFQVGEQSVPAIAGAVKQYVKDRNDSLPESFEMSIWKDQSLMLDGRRELMIENGALGLLLVFIILTLFLRLSLALWVTAGLTTAMVGTFWIMPQFGQSINMMTLFSFIVVLGILVDDAIVVAENVWYHRKNLRKPGNIAAKDGTLEVLVPVILAVLTTIAAFAPMMTAGGTMGQFTRVIPIVVVMALALSLIEALLILPAHLSHVSPRDRVYLTLDPRRWIDLVQRGVSKGLGFLVDKFYKPLLWKAVAHRYLTLCVSVLLLAVGIGLFAGGFVKWEFFPAIDGDNLVVDLSMPDGTRATVTKEKMLRIQRIGEELIHESGHERGIDNMIEHSMIVVGSQPQKAEAAWETGGAGLGSTQGNVGEINIQIREAEDRGGIRTQDLLDEWRKRVGEVEGADELTFKADVSGSAEAINILLKSDDSEQLRMARDAVRKHLANTEGVYDINDDMRPGKLELKPRLLEEGRLKGLTNAELIRQMRQAIFGEETAREQRGRDDVRIKVRLSEEDREKITSIENMKIRLPNGDEVDFSTVAELPPLERGLSAVKRSDRTRSVSITAEVNTDIASANDINIALQTEFLPTFVAKHPGLSFRLEGQYEQQSRTMGDMAFGGLLGVFLIFTILALAFKSWVQPFIVMTAIPFGIAGAIFGHFIYGATFSLLSVIGAMAMAGVVVNGSLILIDFANRATKDGVSPLDAIMESGPRRFRAILMTSLTTFAGLFPMLLEKSLQAQFLIPMAISLGFGVLFSSMIILLVVPALYMVVEDFKRTWAAYKVGLFGPKGPETSEFDEIAPELSLAGAGSARDSIYETVTEADDLGDSTVNVRKRSERPTAAGIREAAKADAPQGLVPDELKDKPKGEN